jgi:hypothetical protein
MFPKYKIRWWPCRDCNFHLERDNNWWTTGIRYVKLSTQIQHKFIYTSCMKYRLHTNNYISITMIWNFEVITNKFKMHGIPLLWLRYPRTTNLCNRKSRSSAQNLPVCNCLHCHLKNTVPQLQLFITVERWWWWQDTKYKDTCKEVFFLSYYWFRLKWFA